MNISGQTRIKAFMETDHDGWRRTQQPWVAEIGGIANGMHKDTDTVDTIINGLRTLTVRICAKYHEEIGDTFFHCEHSRQNMVCGHPAGAFTLMRQAVQLCKQSEWLDAATAVEYDTELDACWNLLKNLDDESRYRYGDGQDEEVRAWVIPQERAIGQRLLPVRKALVAMLMAHVRDAESDDGETLPNA